MGQICGVDLFCVVDKAKKEGKGSNVRRASALTIMGLPPGARYAGSTQDSDGRVLLW